MKAALYRAVYVELIGGQTMRLNLDEEQHTTLFEVWRNSRPGDENDLLFFSMGGDLPVSGVRLSAIVGITRVF